ncbi:MAG: hypothetical protein Fur006_61010 [Coleofasciculaceae cyanobacterium]
MVAPSRYWEMYIIDAREGRGYRNQVLSLAQEFFHNEFPKLVGLGKLSYQQNKDIQASLLSCFRGEGSSVNALSRAEAGLCLRCYISYFIKEACIKLVSQFGTNNRFTVPDVLPFVLNDDGRTLILLDDADKSQVILDSFGELRRSSYSFFTVEILQRFEPTLHSNSYLSSWTYYQTRQNQELKKFLLECGLVLLSDWALLNRARPEQLERLGHQEERDLVEVFHAVYRRDRRKSRPLGTGKCSDPTKDQLNEMLSCLQERGANIHSSEMLMQSLKRVAKLLRDYEIWGYTGTPPTKPLEFCDRTTGDVISIEFPDEATNNLDEIERLEFQEFCTQQFQVCLQQGIEQGVREHIETLRKRPRYTALASQVQPGLQLLYCQGMSQEMIARQLGLNNQTQVSRVLDPKTLLNRVRFLTGEKLFNSVLEQAKNLGLTRISPDSNYLSNLMQQIEAFVDEEVFQQAAAETRNAKNRSMSSLYARRLCHYLKNKQCNL